MRESRASPRPGFNRVYVHQIGPDQDGFFRFYEREILPRFSAAPDATAALPQREAAGDWVGADISRLTITPPNA